MGKIKSSSIPNRLHSRLRDVSTPHVHEDIALHTLKPEKLPENFYRYRQYLTFDDRRVDIYDRECGIKWISTFKPTIDTYALKEGELRAIIGYDCWHLDGRCTYVQLRNTGTDEIIACATLNTGEEEKEVSASLDLSKITSAPVQAEFGICAWCRYSECHPWFKYIVVELTYGLA